jgi:maleylpyruvate isomerase
VQNLKILDRLRAYGLSDDQVTAWAATTITEGLDACSVLLTREAPTPFCFGDAPTLADICLVPQLANARRFGISVRWPRLLGIEERCNDLPSFQNARPEAQPDAE